MNLRQWYNYFVQLQTEAETLDEFNIYTAYLLCINELLDCNICFSTSKQLDNLVYA